MSNHQRRRGGRVAVALVVLLLLGTVAVVTDGERDRQVAPAPSSGPRPLSALTVAQTSTMTGLAPDRPPVPISGRVVNTGQADVHVTAVHVEITSVTEAFDSPEGPCTVGDYRLTAPRMPVDRTLHPGGSASFTGAGIRFHSTASNQDGCQLATVHLRYTTSTG